MSRKAHLKKAKRKRKSEEKVRGQAHLERTTKSIETHLGMRAVNAETFPYWTWVGRAAIVM